MFYDTIRGTGLIACPPDCAMINLLLISLSCYHLHQKGDVSGSDLTVFVDITQQSVFVYKEDFGWLAIVSCSLYLQVGPVGIHAASIVGRNKDGRTTYGVRNEVGESSLGGLNSSGIDHTDKHIQVVGF